MRRSEREKPVRPPKPTGSKRDRVAAVLTLVTIACLGWGFYFSTGTRMLMPGPLTSGHSSIDTCNACHTQNGSSKWSWIHGLVAADPVADSKACLTCHKMPDTAFNAHGASTRVLNQSTRRLTKVATASTEPLSARAQDTAFPMHDVMAGGLFCATCHQEHQGAGFDLKRVSNEQCRSCHVVKFDSFDGHHPEFESYPFKRRTRIIFDHAGHFDQHFPEMAKKDPKKRIPATCSTCHDSSGDRRVMATAPFDRTCATCHLDQILGKERASGPKGIAFLALPGLDLQTLKDRNVPIGEWPEDSEAALTPFMKVMIGRTVRGRALLETVNRLNLQDLANANDAELNAVNDLVWETKGLFNALVTGKASDVLGKLDAAVGTRLTPGFVADLTASIPRDVIATAQRQWLPNLPVETAAGRLSNDRQVVTGAETAAPTPEETPVSEAAQPPSESAVAEPEVDSTTAPAGTRETNCIDPPPRTIEAAVDDGEPALPPEGAVEAGEATDEPEGEVDEDVAVEGRLPLPSGTPRAIRARSDGAEAEDAAGAADSPQAQPATSDQAACADEANDVKQDGVAETVDGAEAGAADGSQETVAAAGQPAAPGDQTDDLLFPTPDELGAVKSGEQRADITGELQPEEPARSPAAAIPKSPALNPNDAEAGSQAVAAPETDFESDVEPESWAEYGGWYRQDYAIFYRPTGHKDEFMHSWLSIAGSQASKGGTSPAAAVFDALVSKDAQGSCTKCHSVDDVPDKGRVVNFLPVSVASKQGRFTNFVHEPHFGTMDGRGCLTCHALERGRPYLKSYEQGNPRRFAPAFGTVKKELCQTCHAVGLARQDCLLCHKYHVNRPTTPVTATRNVFQ